MEARISTKYDLKEKVYTIKSKRVIYGEIFRVRAEISHILGRSEWSYFYDLQISESDSLYSVPERHIFRTREEAEELIKKGW